MRTDVGVSKNITLNLFKNAKGQAIFEFVVFVPFLFILLSIIVSVGSAINASINQQKAVRGYFFSRVAGDSTIPDRDQLLKLRDGGRTSVGYYAIGWRDYGEGDDSSNSKPVAPCFKAATLVKGISGDNCKNLIKNRMTNYVRVKSVFGVCTARYSLDGAGGSPRVRHEGASESSCSLE